MLYRVVQCITGLIIFLWIVGLLLALNSTFGKGEYLDALVSPADAVAKAERFQPWPMKRVPYEFDEGIPASLRDQVLAGMKAIMSKTCVKFVERAGGDVEYVLVKSSGIGCFTKPSGFKKGHSTHVMNILPDRCATHNPILHELMHVLGASHEQSRFDRDKYVTMNWKNIRPVARRQFFRIPQPGEKEHSCQPLNEDLKPHQLDKCQSTSKPFTMGLPYDFESVMHYPLIIDQEMFVENVSEPIMILNKRFSQYNPDLVGGWKLSDLDIKKLNIAYDCN